MSERINGWTITRLPDTADFNYEVERNGFAEKFYSRRMARQYAENRPWSQLLEKDA